MVNEGEDRCNPFMVSPPESWRDRGDRRWELRGLIRFKNFGLQEQPLITFDFVLYSIRWRAL
jgi:hypothetical protein